MDNDPNNLWILIGLMVGVALIGAAIVWNIDRLNRADQRRMREAEQGGTPKGHSAGV